jgi:hypothetical protein
VRGNGAASAAHAAGRAGLACRASDPRLRGSAPFARNLALSPDPDQRFLYVGGGTDIVVVNRKTLEIVTRVQQPGMVGGGHQIGADSKGNIYVAATSRGMQKLSFKGWADSGKWARRSYGLAMRLCRWPTVTTSPSATTA